MTLTECLRRLTEALQKESIPFAVAGGLAASLYRDQPRFTADVDVIVALNSQDHTKVKILLEKLGFKPGIVRQADFEGGPLFAIQKKNTPVVMLTGRAPDSNETVGADILLSNLPWVGTSLARAQNHHVDFGFGKIPVLPLEDVLIAKLYSYSKAVNRPKDLDDLLSIYATDPSPDLVYLQGRLFELEIKLTAQKKKQLPEELRKLKYAK